MTRSLKRATASRDVAEAIDEIAAAFETLPMYRVRRWPSKLFARRPGIRGTETEISAGIDDVSGELVVAVKTRSPTFRCRAGDPTSLSLFNQYHLSAALTTGKRSVYACARFPFGPDSCQRDEMVPLVISSVLTGEAGYIASLTAIAHGLNTGSPSAWNPKAMKKLGAFYQEFPEYEFKKNKFSFAVPSQHRPSQNFAAVNATNNPPHAAAGGGLRVQTFLAPLFPQLTAEVAAGILNRMEAEGSAGVGIPHYGAWFAFKGALLYHTFIANDLKPVAPAFVRMMPSFHGQRAMWAEDMLQTRDFSRLLAEETVAAIERNGIAPEDLQRPENEEES